MSVIISLQAIIKNSLCDELQRARTFLENYVLSHVTNSNLNRKRICYLGLISWLVHRRTLASSGR